MQSRAAMRTKLTGGIARMGEVVGLMRLMQIDGGKPVSGLLQACLSVASLLAIGLLGIGILGCGGRSAARVDPLYFDASEDGVVTDARGAGLRDMRAVVTSLKRQPTVRHLHLYDCNFEDGSFQQLQTVAGIEFLDLRRAIGLGAHCVPAGDFPDLQRVLMQRIACTPDCFDFLAKGPRFKQLTVCYSQMDRTCLENLSQRMAWVEELNLHHAFWEVGSWEALGSFGKVRSLNLDGVIAGPGLFPAIAKMPALEKLSLVQCFMEAGWDELPNLKGCKWLDLTGCPIDDGLAERLKEFGDLELLQLRDTKVTAEKRKELEAALPGCKILDDGSTQADYQVKTMSNI